MILANLHEAAGTIAQWHHEITSRHLQGNQQNHKVSCRSRFLAVGTRARTLSHHIPFSFCSRLVYYSNASLCKFVFASLQLCDEGSLCTGPLSMYSVLATLIFAVNIQANISVFPPHFF